MPVLCTTTSVHSTQSANPFHKHCFLGMHSRCSLCYHILACGTLLLAAWEHSLEELRILSSPNQLFCLHILVCGDFRSSVWHSAVTSETGWSNLWLKLSQWAYSWYQCFRCHSCFLLFETFAQNMNQPSFCFHTVICLFCVDPFQGWSWNISWGILVVILGGTPHYCQDWWNG